MDLKHDARKKERSQSFFSKKLARLSYLSISEQEKYYLVGIFICLVIQARHCGYIVNKNFTKNIAVSYNKLFILIEKKSSRILFRPLIMSIYFKNINLKILVKFSSAKDLINLFYFVVK